MLLPLVRLRAEGLRRHDAIHAIASELTAHMARLIRTPGKFRDVDPNVSYYEGLRKLTAAKWFALAPDPVRRRRHSWL